MTIPLTIVTFALADDPSNLDDDGFPTIVSVVLTLSDGRTVSCDPDSHSLVELLTSTRAMFTDDTTCDTDDADWLQWAKDQAASAATPESEYAELEGDLSGDPEEEEVIASEVGEGAEVEVEAGGEEVTDEPPRPEIKRAGCKKPWEVKGWEDGKLLACVKRHRSEWGTCEYRVLCLPLGRYRLIYFRGNRTDLTVSTEWDDAASMFRALLAQGEDKTRYDARGKRQGTRMTINQFFEKRVKRKKKATDAPESTEITITTIVD